MAGCPRDQCTLGESPAFEQYCRLLCACRIEAATFIGTARAMDLSPSAPLSRLDSSVSQAMHAHAECMHLCARVRAVGGGARACARDGARASACEPRERGRGDARRADGGARDGAPARRGGEAAQTGARAR
eukprot:6121723-Pleurochrysis_carterae.AAC.2